MRITLATWHSQIFGWRLEGGSLLKVKVPTALRILHQRCCLIVGWKKRNWCVNDLWSVDVTGRAERHFEMIPEEYYDWLGNYPGGQARNEPNSKAEPHKVAI